MPDKITKPCFSRDIDSILECRKDCRDNQKIKWGKCSWGKLHWRYPQWLKYNGGAK